LAVAATYTSPFTPLSANYFHESKHENFTCNNSAGGEALPVTRGCLANATDTPAGTALWSHLNDTPFSEERVIQEHIDAGITLADAVNFLVEKYELVRIDRKGFNWQEQSPYLRAVDILRARQATGLLRQSRNNVVR
jgi:hypothetical protein